LLQLITGTLEPTSGSVELNGKVAAVLELGAGFNPDFTGRENIELYCNLLQLDSSNLSEKFDKIIAFSELEQFIDQALKTYSSGMVARLAFSVIAHVDADILIIDEALSVGDAAFSQKCMRFLHDFRKIGTIFFVSHDLNAVKAFCDTAIWLESGAVKAMGPTSEVCDAYTATIYPSTTPVKFVAKKAADPKKYSPHSIQQNENIAESYNTKQGKQQIEAFRFNTESQSFGNGAAEILSLSLQDSNGTDLGITEGQQDVVIKITARAHARLASPILGFFVKDRLGQPLFGGNTYLQYEYKPLRVETGDYFEAVFAFKLPTLLVGSYAITAAVAEGTLKEHSQLHWLYDAALFQISGSTLDGVLVGIPINSIQMRLSEREVS
jgi:lipopolysaccharide transport system ATP-binding protein